MLLGFNTRLSYLYSHLRGKKETIMTKSTDQREALAKQFDRHVEEEGKILQDYHKLSDKLTEGPLSVLINQIVTDEEMHHFLLRTVAEWLRSPRSRSPALPSRA